MAKLNVEIVTPERRLASLQADEVIAPGADGLFGVRPGHTPYLSVMQPGPLTVRDGATTTVYFVTGGFVEAGPTAVRVLADSAELASAIDVAAANKRIVEAETRLKGFEVTDLRAEEQRVVIKREQRRIEVAQGKR
ncbi:MAG: ATP synthase F1 subunit epsilon [Archangium gephyra]|uniref:ATP synthase epsilon chain n=1 Tax=Archangium gephyra TaxID=48 RepID=A0A2W5T545_9BACT|nr:MAG: ATP synthase F1 subunit epsilon [Archangium gephyra]